MKKDVTLKDLSKIANLSANTISCALNGKEGVSLKTRERVKKLAEQYNYRPNMMARSMRCAQNKLIGVLVGDISDNFFVELLAGIEEEARKDSMVIMVGNTDNDITNQSASLDLLLSYKCENFIVTPVDTNNDIVIKLKNADVNFVLADRTIDKITDCNQVSINNRNDSFRAVEYLIKCGHTKIAIFNQYSTISTEIDRKLGYMDAHLANTIKIDSRYEKNIKTKEDIGKYCYEIMNMTDRPTAIFIAKDTLSMQIVSTIINLGFKVPEDISILIYGSPEWSQSFKPFMTCMVRPVKKIGGISARIIMNKKNKGDEANYVNIKLDSMLLERDSVLNIN